MNRYEVRIVSTLLKKHDRRVSTHKDLLINRRIDLPITKVLRKYGDYDVDMHEKELVNQAVENLSQKGFITYTCLPFSSDYEKLYLNIDTIEQLKQYADTALGITPRTFAAQRLKEVMKRYEGKGDLVSYDLGLLEYMIDHSSAQLDEQKEEDLLKALDFLENNTEFLYTREASILIYGDSKYLETMRRSQILSVLYQYYESRNEEVFEEENLLERFHVYDTDQQICLKGPVILEFEHQTMDISGLSGGISVSMKDMESLKSIHVQSETIMTVENRTPFLRMDHRQCLVYLGGFAAKHQTAFIQKMAADNPDRKFMHFGDIDAGGFWIHRKLCEQTGVTFDMYHMGKCDLQNPLYEKCLKPLTESDRTRLLKLREMPEYGECIEYMLENNIKLEQEIISLILYQK
ncbi:MAG: Wadjet anti-phage system protein JetD domain-containing protein [Bulleidia sp.]